MAESLLREDAAPDMETAKGNRLRGGVDKRIKEDLHLQPLHPGRITQRTQPCPPREQRSAQRAGRGEHWEDGKPGNKKGPMANKPVSARAAETAAEGESSSPAERELKTASAAEEAPLGPGHFRSCWLRSSGSPVSEPIRTTAATPAALEKRSLPRPALTP